LTHSRRLWPFKTSSDIAAAGSWARSLAVWGLRGLVVFVCLDLCARIDDWYTWRAPFWPEYSEETLFVVDSLGYHLRPGGRFQKWEVNSFGFRGPEITEAKPSGVTRIVTVGASETFGLHESKGMEYPAQLQSMLDRERPGAYQVLNAAIPGMSPSHVGHYYDAWLRRFAPDIIIYYPTPSFVFEAGEPPPDWTRLAVQQQAPAFRLRITGRIKELYKSSVPRSIQNLVYRVMIERAVRRHPPEWVMATVPPERLAAFEQEITGIVSTIRSGGSRVILATHASRLSTGETPDEQEILLAVRKNSPFKTNRCIADTETKVNALVRRLGETLDVPVVDLNATVPKSAVYLADVSHFTNEGARLAGQAFARAVLGLAVPDRQK
jgi:hypothetical protein